MVTLEVGVTLSREEPLLGPEDGAVVAELAPVDGGHVENVDPARLPRKRKRQT